MGNNSLLDEMVSDHTVQQAQTPARRAAERQMARSLDHARIAKARERSRGDFAAAQARTIAKRSDGPVTLGGLAVGDRFEMKKCASEINGLWRVARIDGANGQMGRILFARRTDGRPGYLPLDENKIRDALHSGVLAPLTK